MSDSSNITFSQDIYRWLLSLDIIQNKGESNQNKQVFIPYNDGLNFQNGYYIAEIIKILLLKNGQTPSDNLKNIHQYQHDNNKQIKSLNWNFIWLSFDDLRMQFDNRIKQLILNGQNSLISEIVKQLYQKDDQKNQRQMKTFIIKQKIIQKKTNKNNMNSTNSNKKDKNKQQNNTSSQNNGMLDIKKISLSKNPDDSQSSLQFLILVLTQSLSMSVEQVLGLFTNQNKYLAHLIVKGINQQFEGVILFYTLLNKHYKKLKYFIDTDPKDAHSCLYAIKPGFISKNQKVSQLTIQLFSKLGNIYSWFTSQPGKGSTTLFLGFKRHPLLLDLYFNLLMQIILNNQTQFFTTYFKLCFKDQSQLIQTCSFLISPLSQSFFKQKLVQFGILDQWLQISIKLFQKDIDGKISCYKFIGEVMNYMPEVIQNNEEYLIVVRNGWKERKLSEFIYLINQIIMIFQRLAGQKNYMAKRLYQIIIDILNIVYDQHDKKQYLLLQFSQIFLQNQSIPVNFMVQVFKDKKLKNYQILLINYSIQLSNDLNCLTRIGLQCLKYFTQDSLIHYHLANSIYQICRKTIDSQMGKNLISKVIKGCLQVYSTIQLSKKNSRVVKNQPMYGNKKGNSQKVSQQQKNQYVFKQHQQKNLISLVQKLSNLVTENVNEDLQKNIKEQLLQANSFIKKNNFKVGSRQISNILNKKFNVTKQQELQHDQDYFNKKALEILQESTIKRKKQPMSVSRFAGPPGLKKQFADVIQKKKKQQEQRKFQQQRRNRQQALKRTLVKKQLQKVNLLRGFAQQAQIKQDGFWQKFKKDENKQLQIYPPELMQPKDIQVIQNLFKKYHRLLRYLFLKYTSSMYTVRQSTSFNDNKQRKQTIAIVQLIKFLKQYKLFFLTSNTQIQNLVRDINVRLLNKRQNLDLDFSGFQQFLIQFCSIIFTKPHSITAKSSKGIENIPKKLIHLSHSQIVADWFDYLRTVFIQKGQKTAIFDQPQAAYFNQTEVIKQFNRKIQEDPGFLLPQGYKKVYDKVIVPQAKISNNITKLKESYIDVMEVLDEIFYESELGLHIIEPILKKQNKVRVKPHAFINVKAKLLDQTESKTRALSSIVQKKAPFIPPIKMLQKKTFSFGMKMGLSYISYKDKLLGQQVAYILDDMLDAIEKGRTTIDKQKIINSAVRSKMEQQQQFKKQQEERKKKLKDRKGQLEKMKKQIEDKKNKQLEETKQQREKEQKKKQNKQKKIKQEKDKYLEEQKKKILQKKGKQDQQKKKEKQDPKKKQQLKKNKQKFQQFNIKQIQKFKSKTDAQSQKRKKQQEKAKQDQKKKQQLYKKLRQKISQKDRKAVEIKQKTNEQIIQLFNSQSIKQVFSQFQGSIKGLFDFLIHNTYVSLTQKKLKNQIILQTWHYFNLVFQLSPLIISAKDLFYIFRSLTKDKQVSLQYHNGLSFQQFKQAILRVAIKHKSVFNKISQKIKQDDMDQKQINDIINKDIEQKQGNQFDQPKEIDVRSLLKEQDVNKEYFNHYGDVTKVNDKTLKGLIYYLKVPRDKHGQEERWREIIASKVKYNAKQTQQLKQKLNQQYSLKKQQRQRQKERIRKRLAASQQNNSIMNSSMMNSSNLKEKQQLQNKAQNQNQNQGQQA